MLHFVHKCHPEANLIYRMALNLKNPFEYIFKDVR